MTVTVTDSGQPPAESPALHDEHSVLAKRDEEFTRVLNAAGLACELHVGQLAQISASLSEPSIAARRMDILETYYAGGGDHSVAERRQTSDRFFVHHDSSACSAHDIVETLAALNPELTTVQLQRGGDENVSLVLRSGESFCAVSDPDDDEAEPETVAVRALVRALNALLARVGVSERLIPLLPDETRELYVGVTEVGAMTLMQSGCTEHDSVDGLREFAGW